MSLTNAQDVFAAIHESGLNDVLRRFFSARPRYLNFGSPGFVATTTVNATQMGAIPFPGISAGINWSVALGVPVVDVHPQSRALPPELTPMQAQRVSLQLSVEICIDCVDHQGQPDHQDPGDKKFLDRLVHGKLNPVCFKVDVFAIAHVERTSSPDGDALRLIVDAVELVDLRPNGMESVIECLILQVLRSALAAVRLPLTALRAGAFTLIPTTGPDVANDMISLAGDL